MCKYGIALLCTDLIVQNVFDFILQICEGKIDIHRVPGDHTTFLMGEAGQQVAGILEKVVG